MVYPIDQVMYRETNKTHKNTTKTETRYPHTKITITATRTHSQGRVSALSRGTHMGNLQASLELPQTSWDISQGGSQLSPDMSVNNPPFHPGQGVHCSD